MSGKMVIPAALLVTLVGWCAARGQAPSSSIETLAAQPGGGPSARDQSGLPSPDDQPHFLSKYITYQRPDCCGPIGGDGPIKYELYLRAGASLPMGGSIFSQDLQAGYMVQGGGRTLFFNPEVDAAWTLDLGIGNTSNHARENGHQIPLSVLALDATGTATRVNFGSRGGPPGVTIRDLNQTYGALILGREWYMTGTAYAPNWRWRLGMDVGGRYGSERAEFHEIRHRTGVIEAVSVAGHTDLEIPCCAITFLAGFRVEWAYTFSNILQSQNTSDFQDLSLLLTAGVRF
jgi:hypothetical protein